MKNINYLNYFAVGLPISILITYPLFKEGAIIFALLSTILTGLIQFILGIKMLIDEPKNKNLKTYIILVIVFFLTLFVTFSMQINEIIKYLLFAFPPILAIYLSVIIYKKAHNENAN
ncbi:hypothetical protein [Flavobacterium sp.]|uniref:hypothetical protein n=1 Tax=Flavobacterium sp. TaxID=239 RepID=UPI003752E131